jgi:hypothetical protein
MPPLESLRTCWNVVSLQVIDGVNGVASEHALEDGEPVDLLDGITVAGVLGGPLTVDIVDVQECAERQGAATTHVQDHQWWAPRFALVVDDLELSEVDITREGREDFEQHHHRATPMHDDHVGPGNDVHGKGHRRGWPETPFLLLLPMVTKPRKNPQIQVRYCRKKRALETPPPVQFESLGGFELEIGMGRVCGDWRGEMKAVGRGVEGWRVQLDCWSTACSS